MSENKTDSSVKFIVFRYGITPIREVKEDLFFKTSEIDRLIATKNAVFEEVLLEHGKFDRGARPTTFSLLHREGDFFLFRVAVEKIIHHERKDFSTENLANWPSVFIAVWNDPNRQLVAVQDRSEAFKNPETAVNYLFDSMAYELGRRLLTVSYKQLFEERDFWKVVEKNKGNISIAEFTFATPNMSRIHATLNEAFEKIGKTTNSKTNTVKLQAPADHSLILEPTNPEVAGLVEYASKGGGDIKLKIRNVKKKWSTEKSTKEVSVDKLDIEGPPDKAVRILKDILEL